MKEEVIYKPLPGFEGLYSVGNNGTILKHKGNVLLTPNSFYTVRQKGIVSSTASIRIIYNGTRYCIPLAKTVAELFVPNPKGYKYVDYIDGNRDNCCYKNLIWVKHKIFKPKEDGFGIKFRITKDSKLKWI